MIPYLDLRLPSLFGFELHLFGFLVGIAIVVGHEYAKKKALEKGMELQMYNQAAMYVMVFGFVISHWFEMIFYQPDRLWQDGPLEMLKIWQGLSSYGGFIGGFIGIVIFCRLKKYNLIPICEIFIQGIIVAWIFGRAGCTVAHDHPGALSDFFLAVKYPGGPRHDLGLYEFLYTLFIIFPGMLYLQSKKPKSGVLIVYAIVIYAPVRFILDALRATDRPGADLRFFGMTAAQYVSLGLFMLGIYYVYWLKKHPQEIPLKAKK